MEDQHPDSDEIQKTLKDTNAQWKDLYEKSMEKGNKLREASQQHALNKALADAQVKHRISIWPASPEKGPSDITYSVDPDQPLFDV